MLTSPIRSISDFSSAAGDARLQIAQARLGDTQRRSLTEVEREGLRTIHLLVDLGARFGHPPEGNLDVSGSTPEQIDLAASLGKLIPGELAEVRTDTGAIDIPSWSRKATEVLGRLEAGSSWSDLAPDEREFVGVELEPFLKALLKQPPEEPQE